MIKFVNMTPHAINLVSDDGSVYRIIEASGNLIRLKAITEQMKELDGVKLSTTVFG